MSWRNLISIEAQYEIAVVGGGIIGCTIANELAAEGKNVVVVERGQLCAEASWAAAGMLAPYAETVHGLKECMHNLMLTSHKMYPEFVAKLEKDTGIDVGLQRQGSLLLALDYPETKMLAGLFERSNQNGYSAEALTTAEIHIRQPELVSSVEAGLYFPHDCHVRARLLGRAVISSAQKKGVQFKTGVPITAFRIKDNHITGIETATGVISAESFVLAAGAWSGGLLAASEQMLPVRPIRGQMVQLQVQTQFINQLTHSGNCYLVPWPDGRLLVGATMENVGFDKAVTAGGLNHLLTAATKVFPKLSDAPVKQSWAGLRPDTRDNMPIIGRGHLENLIIATGHFRNGILLAPVTAKLVLQILKDETSLMPLIDFSPSRFDL